MIKTPYDTTVCRHYHLEPVIAALKLAKIEGETLPAQSSSKKRYLSVKMVHPYAKEVPPFTQPLSVDGVWYLDGRGFQTVDRGTGDVRATAPGELDFLILRGLLSKLWAEGQGGNFSYFQDLPARVYARLISEAVVRRLGLDPMEQLRLSVLAATYYFSQFFGLGEGVSESERVALATRVGRATSIGADKALAVIDQLEHLPKTIEEFCTAAKQIMQSMRKDQLNAALLITSISGMWYGANGRETLAASLEYPPFFNALVAAALTERSYKTAPFAKLVLQCEKNGSGNAFVRHLNELFSLLEE